MTCTKDQLFGLFESLDTDEEKIKGLKDQIEVIKSGIGGMESQYKEFSKDYEVPVADLKKAYKYYKAKRDGGSVESEDYYTICVMVDQEFVDGEDA